MKKFEIEIKFMVKILTKILNKIKSLRSINNNYFLEIDYEKRICKTLVY